MSLAGQWSVVALATALAPPLATAASFAEEPRPGQPIAPAPGAAISPTAVIAKYEIKTLRPAETDSATSVIDGDRMTIEIRNAEGIGSTVVSRPKGGWPKNVVLKLHFRGLESLDVKTAKAAMNVSMLSHGEGEQLTSFGRTDDAKSAGAPIDARHPMWPKVARRREDGAPSDPKKFPFDTRLFDVTLPTGLFDDDPESLELRWIDFFRR